MTSSIRNVPVHEVCYFQFGSDTVGYVIHDEPDTFEDLFWISMAPFVISTAIAILLGIIAISINQLQYFGKDIVMVLSFWLTFSIAMHSIPSAEDAECVFGRIKNEIKEKNYSALLTVPIAGGAYILSKLRIFWSQYVWALCLMLIAGFIVVLFSETIF